jgi:hypothetical protein
MTRLAVLAPLTVQFVLPATRPPQFQITDGRGKETSAVTIEASQPDADGWYSLRVARAKGDAVLVWPFDGSAKPPDGPEPVPVIVIQKGDPKALANQRTVAAVATGVLLGRETVEDCARRTGWATDALVRAFAGLVASSDPFEKGVGLLYAAKPAEAAEELAVALRQRQRQLTRMPSEIYAAGMLNGWALFKAGKFDAAGVAFLAALKQRPSDEAALKGRTEALVKAGKPEAAVGQ